ncbi:MAG: DUF4372 domain-containing protein [Parasutterella sp.]
MVNKYQSDKGAKGLTTWSQFIAMLFCQLTGADSLREISTVSIQVSGNSVT